jgi:hypothetical protein
MDAWIANRKNDREETTPCQYETGASIKKMEPNPGEKETAVERQEIPNEEIAVHFPRACRCETAASQEAAGANTEKTGPEPGMMQSVEEHQEIP